MPYKRSTQSQGFRGKQTYNPTKELEKRAKALDNKRVAEVKEYEKVANQQLQEMQRIDNVMTSNDAFEVKMLAENSKHFKDLLQQAAGTVGKALVEDERQKGIDTYRKAEAGDPEAKAKVDLSEKQNAEIEIKMRELKKNIDDKLNFDPRKERLTLEQQYRAENIRKLGRQQAYGYNKMAMAEAVKGYLPWFMDQQNNPDALHYNDDVDVIIDGQKVALKVSGYNTYQSSAKQKAIEDHLELQYVSENSPEGMRGTIIDENLSKHVQKQTDTYRNSRFAQKVISTAQEEIKERSLELYSLTNKLVFTSEGDDQTESTLAKDNLVDALETMFAIGGNTHFRAGTGTEGPNVANRKQIISDITTAFMLADEEQREVLEDILTNTKLTIPNLGEQTILEWGIGEFDMDSIKADALDKSQAARLKLNKVKSDLLEVEGVELMRKLDDGEIPLDEYNIKVEDLRERFGGTTKWYQWGATKLVGYETKNLTIKVADTHAQQLLDPHLGFGFIPLSETKGWPKAVLEKYGDKGTNQIIDNQELSTPKAKDFIKSSTENYSTALKAIAGLAVDDELVSGQLKNRIQHASNQLVPLAIKLQKEGHQIKNADGQLVGAPAGTGLLWYLKQADQQIDQEIASYAVEGSEYHWDAGNDVFTKAKGLEPRDAITDKNSDTVFDVATANLGKSRIAITKAKSIIKSHGGADAFAEVDMSGGVVSRLEPQRNPDGGITGYSPWIKKLTSLDSKNRTAFEIMNLQRVAAGMDAIPLTELPEAEAKAQQILSQTFPHVRALFKTGDVRSFKRGMDQLGLVEVRGMTEAIRNNLGDTPIVSPGELPVLLREMNISTADYDNDISVREKVDRYKINKVLVLASSQTNSRSELIRRTAIGIKYGESDMDIWNQGEIYENTSKSNFGMQVYNSYLGGTSDEESQTVQVVTAGPTSGKTIELITTRDLVNQKVEDLKLREPEERIPQVILPWHRAINPSDKHDEGLPKGYVYHKTATVYNPAHAKWTAEVEKANDHLAMLDLFSDPEKLGMVYWGTGITSQSSEATTLARQVLGKKVFNEIREQAAENVGKPSILDSLLTIRSQSKLYKDYSNEFERLLMERPEFQPEYIRGY
jgi:hypothetical protein